MSNPTWYGHDGNPLPDGTVIRMDDKRRNPMNTPKEEQRAPMLGDSQRSFIISKHVWKDDKFGKALKIADEVRDFYENLITSGELMVVKKARFVLPEKHTDYGYCSECKKPVDMSKQPVPFFHTCGAEIVK